MNIWLSHILDKSTPAYGGGSGFSSSSEKLMCNGDSCNTSQLHLSNHIGTHVDAPKHFVEQGVSVEAYKADEWVFTNPLIINVNLEPGEIITLEYLKEQIDPKLKDADLVLIRSGLESYRDQDIYWKSSLGISPDIYYFLAERFPSFSTIGMDMISISSYQHRDLGREAHQIFLGNGIRIIEDMALAELDNKKNYEIVVLPLRFSAADGAPVTVIARVS